MRFPRLLVLPLVSALSLVLAPAALAPAASGCRKLKEKKGCALPEGATYEKETTKPLNQLHIRVLDGFSTGTGILPVTCTKRFPDDRTDLNVSFGQFPDLYLPKKLKVGKTYKKTWNIDQLYNSNQARLVGWRRVTAKITSAKSAKLTLENNTSDDGVDDEPPPRVCKGSKSWTLKRVR